MHRAVFMLIVSVGTVCAQGTRPEFASDRPGPLEAAPFDGKRAMDYLEAICAIGPRISGSEGMKKQQELIQQHFEKLGAKVERQRFPAKQKSRPAPIEMTNLIVRWNPERPKRVLLAAHYDTKPTADREPNPRKRTEPFLSANDGGSGVAFLMELGNHMKELKTTLGVDFIFFDGEEFVHETGDDYFFGSRHFAAHYRKVKKEVYCAGIVLDMIGGKNARFPMEQNSWFHAAPLVLDIWNTAEQLGCACFQKTPGQGVQDDHIALNRAGIPCVDIIDFSYKHWHRLSDVPANCSGESLETVSRVLSIWLQKTK